MQNSPVNFRNLEQIHEDSGIVRNRLSTAILSSAALAAIVVAVVASSDRKAEVDTPTVDPLSVLVASSKSDSKGEPDFKASELSYPSLLSDDKDETSALVMVKDEKGRIKKRDAEPRQEEPLPEKAEAAPRPAGDLLTQSKLTEEPQDELSRLAKEASEVAPETPLAEAGTEGAFVIQVASFQKQEDADAFVLELRKRKHRAFREAANVPGRGLWHRVRIGPFKNRYRAVLYKTELEKTERISALVIDRERVQRQNSVRAAQVAERLRKYGSQ